MELPGIDELRRATELVRTVMPPIPTYSWPLLNQRAGAEVWLKHENHSPVGAFKLRTATVYLDWLRRTHPAVTSVVAASSGNYGRGVASASKRLGLKATIVVPVGTKREKIRAIEAQGADVVEHGQDFEAANEYATGLAAGTGGWKAPAFDPLLALGAGTYALEMFESAPELDTVYVPVGMGSSICGMVAAREALGLTTGIVGVGAKAAPANALSFAAGEVIVHEVRPTLADGVAGRIPAEEALTVMLKHVERFVEVDEDEIAAAMRAIYEDTHNVAEGAGAVTTAAILQERSRSAGKRVGAVITSGNVDREVFASVLGAA